MPEQSPQDETATSQTAEVIGQPASDIRIEEGGWIILFSIAAAIVLLIVGIWRYLERSHGRSNR